jgi:hypothetical protein
MVDFYVFIWLQIQKLILMIYDSFPEAWSMVTTCNIDLRYSYPKIFSYYIIFGYKCSNTDLYITIL